MSATTGDLRSVHVIYAGPTGGYVNSFGFAARQPVAGDDLADLASAFRTALVKNTSGGLLYGANSGVSVTTIRVEDVKPGTVATYESVAAAVTGASATEMLPPQAAIVFTFSTLTKGRSYRGRIYLPGATEENAGAGTLTGAAVTLYSTIGVNLLAIFGPSGSNANWQHVVISRYANHVKRATPVGTAVTSITLDPVLQTQRRRVLGVGA